MAISDTMSSPSSDWPQLYHRNSLTSTTSLQGSNTILADATVVTTTVTSSTVPGGAGGGLTTTRQLSPDGGRVSKPARRRRASRAAPTTLLNTDTSNFRAMVQQFTGVPSAPFTFGSQISAPNLSFGLAAGAAAQQHQNVTGLVGPRGNYYSGRYHQHLHYDQQQQQQQQQQHYYQMQQQYSMFPDAFRGNNNLEGASDVLMNLEGVSSHHDQHHHEQHQGVLFPPAAGSSPSSTGNRSTNNGGYHL